MLGILDSGLGVAIAVISEKNVNSDTITPRTIKHKICLRAKPETGKEP